jgi:hypothetical protein
MGYIKYKLATKLIAPILCVFVLSTLKPFLRILSTFINPRNQQSYLESVAALGKNSNVGKGSLVAVFLSIVVFITIASLTLDWFGNGYYSMSFAAFFAVIFFYGYFFLYIWNQVTVSGKLKNTSGMDA